MQEVIEKLVGAEECASKSYVFMANAAAQLQQEQDLLLDQQESSPPKKKKPESIKVLPVSESGCVRAEGFAAYKLLHKSDVLHSNTFKAAKARGEPNTHATHIIYI